MTTFIIRVVIGVLVLVRAGQKLGRPGQTADELEHVGFRRPRTIGLVTGIVQLVAGVMILAGILVPLAAGLVLGIAVNAALIRGQESGWASPGGMLDSALVAGGLVLGFISPGALAIERAIEWEVGGGALGVFAIVIGALIAAAGTQLRDARKVRARREGTTAQVEELAATPVEPLDTGEATDPAATTQGESQTDPIRHRDETEGPPDVDEEEARERAEPQRELGDPPVPPLDPAEATDPAARTEGESRPDPIGQRERSDSGH
ncbi:MAG: DoxX family membrane protein [Nitriliruptorales bacterium]|nr:DoxX family membrane protein [Nitriliruptorales bacterium]